MSYATENNWKRLGVDKKQTKIRLSKRANKRYSTRNIIPVECFSDIKNLSVLDKILKFSEKYSVKEIVYNLALNYLKSYKLIDFYNNEIISDNEYILEILDDSYIYYDLLKIRLPKNEQDFLGVVYQSLLQEGSKNIKGSYYTPKCISEKMTQKINDNRLFLDPCCGSGSFLLSVAENVSDPKYLYGCDIDEIACFIAKINLIIKYRKIKFRPNIYNVDFLINKKVLGDIKFDVVATNPPWGAMTNEKYEKLYPEISSKESFSYFIYAVDKVLKRTGVCYFILPKSILNVKAHKDIRKFILEKYSIREIELLGRVFSGVLSSVVFICLAKNKNSNVKIKIQNKEYSISSSFYKNNVNYNFSLIDGSDAVILDKVYSKKHNNLRKSLWALGIVTGDNKKYVHKKIVKGCEKIYTGKEVSKYFLANSEKYIVYNRDNFQQTADDKLYRASEKLVYKFISKRLVFAYDNTSSLVLNSANILIPNVETHSIKTVLAFLNSKLFDYLYSKRFGDIKILKNNLCDLPFPILCNEMRKDLEDLVNDYLSNKTKNSLDKIDNFIYDCFDLTKNEINIVEGYKNEK